MITNYATHIRENMYYTLYYVNSVSNNYRSFEYNRIYTKLQFQINPVVMDYIVHGSNNQNYSKLKHTLERFA